MAQLIRTCMISLYFIGGASIALYGYELLQTSVHSLFQATYNPANIHGTDSFSTEMQTTLTDIQAGL